MRILDDEEITVRAANFLIRKGINNFEDLSNVTQKEVMEWHNLGRKSLEEILRLMKKYNVKFKNE
jgi:DNA-directed RNA polymerase alpha subunit